MGITSSTLQTLGISDKNIPLEDDRLIRLVRLDGIVGNSVAEIIVRFCDEEEYCHPWKISIVDKNSDEEPANDCMLFIKLNEWGELCEVDNGLMMFSGLPAFAAAGSLLILKEAMAKVEFTNPTVTCVEYLQHY